jgi:hypothetical protein
MVEEGVIEADSEFVSNVGILVGVFNGKLVGIEDGILLGREEGIVVGTLEGNTQSAVFAGELVKRDIAASSPAAGASSVSKRAAVIEVRVASSSPSSRS